MPNNYDIDEKYINSTEEDVVNFMKNIKSDMKNSMAPKPPIPGEIIRCQICGKEMYPKDFSKDEKKRQKEWKWHYHYNCWLQIDDLCDRSTPGLLSERGKK